MRRSPELTEPLSVVQVAAVEAEREGSSWLVEGLWEEEGVGILGGAPKSCKSWLALDFAFSVAHCAGSTSISNTENCTRWP